MGGDLESALKEDKLNSFKHSLQVSEANPCPVQTRHLRLSPFNIWVWEKFRNVLSCPHLEQRYSVHSLHIDVWLFANLVYILLLQEEQVLGSCVLLILVLYCLWDGM